MPISAAPAMMPAQIGSWVSTHRWYPPDSLLLRVDAPRDPEEQRAGEHRQRRLGRHDHAQADRERDEREAVPRRDRAGPRARAPQRRRSTIEMTIERVSSSVPAAAEDRGHQVGHALPLHAPTGS